MASTTAGADDMAITAIPQWKPSMVYALTERMRDLLGRGDLGKSYARQELKDVAQQLSASLESPSDTLERLAYYVRWISLTNRHEAVV